MGQKQQIEGIFTALLCAALTLVSFDGCSSKSRPGEVISTNLSISSYAEARQRADPNQQVSRFYFPVLEIYNQAGALVYVSHESDSNAKVLKDFPNSVQNLTPQNQAPLLEKILEQIPDFKLRKEEIVGKKRLVILSVALRDCEGCAVQEEALDEVKEHLLQQKSVAILKINVARP